MESIVLITMNNRYLRARPILPGIVDGHPVGGNTKAIFDLQQSASPRLPKTPIRASAQILERPLEEHEVRLSDDLGGLTTGEVRLDDLTRGAYSCDASILQVRPAAVVMPKTPQELGAIVKFAADNNLPIHAPGGGTGLAGESLGSGIVIDVSRHLTRILAVGPDWVTVEPGVRLAFLQQELAKYGRMIAVDPISGDRCTIGGMVATNAAGPHSLRYGTIRDHILSVRGLGEW